ncbi:hypothetical protein GCM10027190_15080 [Spirosoma areae]
MAGPSSNGKIGPRTIEIAEMMSPGNEATIATANRVLTDNNGIIDSQQLDSVLLRTASATVLRLIGSGILQAGISHANRWYLNRDYATWAIRTIAPLNRVGAKTGWLSAFRSAITMALVPK